MSFSDDGDFFSLASLLAKGWTAFILAAIAIVFYLMALSVEYQCDKMTCPYGQKPVMIGNDCACVGTPIRLEGFDAR